MSPIHLYVGAQKDMRIHDTIAYLYKLISDILSFQTQLSSGKPALACDKYRTVQIHTYKHMPTYSTHNYLSLFIYVCCIFSTFSVVNGKFATN